MLKVVDICGGGGIYGRGVVCLVCSNTRINNNCSVDSDDDFRWDYRNVSYHYWLPSVKTFQEYSNLEDQTRRSNSILVNYDLFNTNHTKGIMWNS